ncbi:alpha/beta fold hydrolase [Pseudonocardia acaciae]|uniref:alpha/beta fold hydrolase n=1 Tax=Pseudonocardia acaciae TaxID=551276 RepID=UPI000AF2CE60|nr:alpha/beta fold hydrolase [Pseudonocardia acaciae]
MTVWTPDGSSRGTVVVVHGRGEHPGVYQRIGRRLAADGYTVVAPDLREDGFSPAHLYATLAAHPGGSRVLLGADSGAVHAWTWAAENPGELDALVLAGLPLEPAAEPPGPGFADRDAELAARTSCPVHRELIGNDPGFGWGALVDLVPQPPATLPDLPVLILHGDADPVAPVAPVRLLAARRPGTRCVVVSGGVHDVLNDRFHRSVAAQLVLFVEEIGKGAVLLSEPLEPAKPVRARRAAPLHVSARLDYALRAVAELIAAGTGSPEPGEPVRCEAIARARDIPLNSLVNLMIELRRAGLVRSQRGCEGGYWLARPSSEITVADVVRAVEGVLVSLHTAGPDSWLWHRLGQTVAEFLEAWTVEDVATRQIEEAIG